MPVYTAGAVAIRAKTDDGWTLVGERLVAADAPVVVVMGHAMMVDRRTLDRPSGAGLASALHAAGLDVSWLDARGHGESGPRADEGGRFSYDDFVRHDVPALVAHGRSIARGRRLVLLGHSLIGHAAMIAAGLFPERAPDAIVAYAPNLWAPHLEPSRAARMIKAAALTSWGTVARATGYFDPTRFGLGRTPLAEPYIAQFEAMWRADRLEGCGDDYEAALGRSVVDVMAVSSRNDRLFAHPDAVARFLALARNASVEHRVLEGPDAPDHMGLVTDGRSKSLWQETASWILALGR